MKRGFTLIEIVVVLAILGIIITLFVPNTIKIIKENSYKVYKIKEKEIIKAAEDYVLEGNSFEGPQYIQDVSYITINELVNKGYINKILDNSSGNECMGFIKVTKSTISGYEYETCLICDNYKSDKDYCNMESYNNL